MVITMLYLFSYADSEQHQFHQQLPVKEKKKGSSEVLPTHASNKEQRRRGLEETLCLQESGHNHAVHETIDPSRRSGSTQGGNK